MDHSASQYTPHGRWVFTTHVLPSCTLSDAGQWTQLQGRVCMAFFVSLASSFPDNWGTWQNTVLFFSHLLLCFLRILFLLFVWEFQTMHLNMFLLFIQDPFLPTHPNLCPLFENIHHVVYVAYSLGCMIFTREWSTQQGATSLKARHSFPAVIHCQYSLAKGGLHGHFPSGILSGWSVHAVTTTVNFLSTWPVRSRTQFHCSHPHLWLLQSFCSFSTTIPEP